MKKAMTALGLPAIAALALTAIVGPTSAFAVERVCSTTGVGAACGAGHGNELTVNDIIKAASTNARLTSSFVEVTCGHSEVEMKITGNTPPTGNIIKQTFTECHSNLNTTKNSCTASTTATAANPWPATATTTTAPNGKLQVADVTGEFDCVILGVHNKCIYSIATPAKGGDGHSLGEEIKINGGEIPTIEAKHVELSKETGSSGSCSANGIWEGIYTVTQPATLFMD